MLRGARDEMDSWAGIVILIARRKPLPCSNSSPEDVIVSKECYEHYSRFVFLSLL